MTGFIGGATTITFNFTYNSSNQCLRLAPFLHRLRMSSIVTDLVLIFESVTCSASGVRWLTLHSWVPDFWILLRLTQDGFSFTNESRISYIPFYNSVRTEDRTLPLIVHAILRMSIPRQRPVVMDMRLANSVSEPLPINGLFQLSGFLICSL
jgi:hypothetical protein